VTSVSVYPPSISVIEGVNAQLFAVVLPEDADDKTLTWSSNAPGVATVNASGLVSALAPGTAIITATSGDVSATCTVIVSRYYTPREQEVRAFVRRFYLTCLDREPEEGGWDAWTRLLLDGTLSGRDFGYMMIGSEEYAQRNRSSGDYLTDCYYAFFDREPDEDGFNAWLRLLNLGFPRMAFDPDPSSNIYDGFAYSLEFAQLCMRFNIRPY
jgi:hypothetical protein